MPSQKVDNTMNFTVKLINLDASEGRLKSATDSLVAAGFDFERFPAIDGRKRNDLVAEYYDDEGALKVMGRSLSRGEIGCYLSHLICLKEFLSGSDSLLLVIEDDFAFVRGGAEAIRASLELLKDDSPFEKPWMVTLGRRRKKIFRPFASFSAGGTEWNLRRAYYIPDRTTGIIWSKAAATRFVSDFNCIRYPIDVELQLWCGKNRCGLAFDDPPLRSDPFESTIDSGAKSARRIKRSRLVRRLDKFRLIILYLYALRAFVVDTFKASFAR